MDFRAPEGTPIAAAGSGKVVKVNFDGNGLGLYVEIDHGGGLVTQYGHMSGVAVSDGTEIKAGQTIGYVGQTGNSTGAHLHFAVMRNGEKVNPRSFLTGKPENKFSAESNTPFKKLLKPKKKSKTKIVKVPEIVYVPVYDSTQGPRLKPQSPSPVSGKQTNFYLN
jgi:murein DD-endopeptidase MepM/ murein hydrolase activator NlpD